MTRLFAFLLICFVATSAMAQETVDWRALANVSYEKTEVDGYTTYIPQFADDVVPLDGQKVKLSGFMIPLDFSEVQTNFLISAMPGDGCYFHMPGGPNSIAEIQAELGVDFTYDTVEIEGTLQLLKDDPYGLLYRIVDAKPVK